MLLHSNSKEFIILTNICYNCPINNVEKCSTLKMTQASNVITSMAYETRVCFARWKTAPPLYFHSMWASNAIVVNWCGVPVFLLFSTGFSFSIELPSNNNSHYKMSKNHIDVKHFHSYFLAYKKWTMGLERTILWFLDGETKKWRMYALFLQKLKFEKEAKLLKQCELSSILYLSLYKNTYQNSALLKTKRPAHNVQDSGFPVNGRVAIYSNRTDRCWSRGGLKQL